MDTPSHGRADGDERWNRLQAYLLDLQPGHVVTIDDVAQATGLDATTIEMVLQALTRASLFHSKGATTFVRQRIELDGA